MDPYLAIQFALLVEAAEAVAPDNLTNAAGQTLNVSYGAINLAYKVLTTIYANDLATDANPDRGNDTKSFGLLLQAPNNDLVIAIRGTDDIWEWMDDAEFLTVTFPYLAGAGTTEDGFTAIYKSLRIGSDPASARVTDALATLPINRPAGALTICGHSLGGAVATLLALDTAANTAFKTPAVFTYASPRTGDPAFVTTYNQVVPNTFRIANRKDLVPKLPLPPFYGHVLGLYELLPGNSVKLDLACQHHLTTYLFLLTQLAAQSAPANPILPLDAGCAS